VRVVRVRCDFCDREGADYVESMPLEVEGHRVRLKLRHLGVRADACDPCRERAEAALTEALLRGGES
jgi:hypothetical protein